KTGKTRTLGPEIHAMLFGTGGGFVDNGPPFTWLDAETILLVREEKRRSNEFADDGPETPTTVCTLDIRSGQLTEIVTLPRWERRPSQPFFADKDAVGTPRIVLGKLGQFQIDLAKKRLLEDDTRSGDYRYRSGRPPE